MKKLRPLVTLLPALMLAACAGENGNAGKGNAGNAAGAEAPSGTSAAVITGMASSITPVGAGVAGPDLTNAMIRAAIDNHYVGRCISIGKKQIGGGFPITVLPSTDFVDSDGNHRTDKWNIFVKQGLLSTENQGSADGFPVGPQADTSQGKTFYLTPKGQAALGPDGAFCAGYYKVDDIKTKTPGAAGPAGEPTLTVEYRMSPVKMPDWARHYNVRMLWPEMRLLLKKKRPMKVVLVQTSSGWVTEEDYNSGGHSPDVINPDPSAQAPAAPAPAPVRHTVKHTRKHVVRHAAKPAVKPAVKSAATPAATPASK